MIPATPGFAVQTMLFQRENDPGPSGVRTAKDASAMNPILLFDTFVCRVADHHRLRLRAFLIAMLLGSLTIGLNSCATARGFGQDVEHVGDKIEEAASR